MNKSFATANLKRELESLRTIAFALNPDQVRCIDVAYFAVIGYIRCLRDLQIITLDEVHSLQELAMNASSQAFSDLLGKAA